MNTPKNLIEANQQLEAKMIEVLAIFESRFKKSMTIPKINLRRLGLRLGLAHRLTNEISLNSDLINDKYWDRLINEVLPHEICHLVALWMYNTWDHGWSWKSCMRAIGLQPNRCATLDDEAKNLMRKRNVERKFAYKCGCKELHFVTKIKHNRCQSGKYRRFHCLRCRVTLQYVGEKLAGLQQAA